ncbi:MAG: SPFH domain-containing protein [Eubacteriales bacterium]
MGLIKAISGAVGGITADQWREYFYADSLPNNVLVTKGQKRISGKRSSNTSAEDNIISNGSIIAVNEGQCMIIVEQGKVVELCADAGEFTYDASTEPTLLYGNLGENIGKTFANIGKRFTFGGDTAKDQRVYYFNTKEMLDNKFGTMNPIPFRVVDARIGLDMDMAIRCNGSYSFKIIDPILFYTNVCGNVNQQYRVDEIASQLKTEFLTALQPAFGRISALGIRYSEITTHTMELVDEMNKVLTTKWSELRGIAIVSVGVNGATLSEEDQETIKEYQKMSMLTNPAMAAASLTKAQSEAMVAAASNESTGPMMAFAGMNMANSAGGMNATQLYGMAGQGATGGIPPVQTGASAPTPAPAMVAPSATTWTCSCGTGGNTGKFCMECGSKSPEELGWTCTCGVVNKGKFCMECGSKKPSGALLYKCDKCGWEPDEPTNPPKFCPECGDLFDENDIQS